MLEPQPEPPSGEVERHRRLAHVERRRALRVTLCSIGLGDQNLPEAVELRVVVTPAGEPNADHGGDGYRDGARSVGEF